MIETDEWLSEWLKSGFSHITYVMRQDSESETS